jgi:3'(2'), 5'-bisphosphate nucleotidase
LADHNLQHELDTAKRLALQAGEMIMDYYEAGLPVHHKSGHEPVTAADRAADDLISTGLSLAFPTDGLLTEESDDDLSRLKKDRVWIVDPLDGTVEFITGTGEFAVQIALAIEGNPLLGVVYQPVRQRLFYAVRGGGAYEVQKNRETRLRVSAVDEPARMCLVASRSHYSTLIDTARAKLGISSVNHLGSVGLKVGLVAQGACDLYLATATFKEWDVCAPHALLVEAGGTLTNRCGEPLAYNKADVTERGGLIGSNGLAHTQIVETLAPLLGRC